MFKDSPIKDAFLALISVLIIAMASNALIYNQSKAILAEEFLERAEGSALVIREFVNNGMSNSKNPQELITKTPWKKFNAIFENFATADDYIDSVGIVTIKNEKPVILLEAKNESINQKENGIIPTVTQSTETIQGLFSSGLSHAVNYFANSNDGSPIMQSFVPLVGKNGSPMVAIYVHLNAEKLQADFLGITHIFQLASILSIIFSFIFALLVYDTRRKQHRANIKKKSTLEISGIYKQTVQDLIQSFSSSSHALYEAASAVNKKAHLVQDDTNSSSAMVEQFAQTIQSLTNANEQLSEQLSRLLDNAITCNDIAKDTSSRVNQASQSFGNIGQTSEQTAGAIKLILEVSNRIDLLAVNAAIEAARAGDFGRGFSVVATEVKSLSQQAKKAAETISNLLKHSEETVKESMDAVYGIRGSVHETNYMSEELSNLAKSQQSLQEDITESIKLLTEQSNRLKQSLLSVNGHVEDATYKTTEMSTMSNHLRDNTQKLETESNSFLLFLTDGTALPEQEPEPEKPIDVYIDLPDDETNSLKSKDEKYTPPATYQSVLEAVPMNDDGDSRSERLIDFQSAQKRLK